jgi:hypothetical protein
MKLLEKQIQTGCTTNVVLDADLFTSKTIIAGKKNGNDFIVNEKKIDRKSGINYYVDGVPVGPFALNGLYGSGDSLYVTGSIWNYISSNLAQDNYNATELFFNLTAKPAELLHIEAGIIEKGYPADVILFKIQENWDISSTDSLLESIFLHQGNDGKVAGVFKNGILLYGSDEVSNLIKQNTLSKYYSEPNIAPTTLNAKYEFDSIESALEDFRTNFLRRKRRICGCSGQ